MASSRWPTVVDAILERVRARTGFQAPTGVSDDVRVYDGPEIDQRADDVTRYLVIGLPSEGPNSSGDSGQFSQKATRMASTRPRNESGLVRCKAVSQLGDVDTAASRTAAFEILAAVEDELRTPFDGPTLGISAPRMVVQIDNGTQPVKQYLAGGSVCEIEFDLTYETEI